MEQCITIASACNLYWRRHHLSADCIAVEPEGGWQGARNNQSLKALKWLKWVEHTLREEERDSGLPARTEDRVTHAGSRGEHAIVTTTRVCYVDGFDPVTQTVYEFHGCVWHGCPRCHPNHRLVPRVHLDRSMEEVYDATCAKTALLRSMGFTVVEMWECFWDDLSKHDPRLIQFLHTLEIVEPLDPRHAFYGGRTGATCLYHKTDEAKGEKVHYIDVTSEYPWVNKYRTYPVGRPQILTSPQIADLSDYYGIAKVDIVPPEELFNPVLPYRSGGKLTFPLCRTCVEQQQANRCSTANGPVLTPIKNASSTVRGVHPKSVKQCKKGTEF